MVGTLSTIEEVDEDNEDLERFEEEVYMQEEVAVDWSTDNYGGSWHTWQGFEDEEELENEEINNYGYENIQGNWVFDEVERLLEMGVEEIWECEWWLQMIEVEF